MTSVWSGELRVSFPPCAFDDPLEEAVELEMKRPRPQSSPQYSPASPLSPQYSRCSPKTPRYSPPSSPCYDPALRVSPQEYPSPNYDPLLLSSPQYAPTYVATLPFGDEEDRVPGLLLDLGDGEQMDESCDEGDNQGNKGQ